MVLRVAGQGIGVREFVEVVVSREGFSDISRIALAAWPGPRFVLGVVFEVGGRWIHASDYGDLEEEDWQDVDVGDALVVFERERVIDE